MQGPQSRFFHIQGNCSPLLSFTLSPNFRYCLSNIMNVIWHLEKKLLTKLAKCAFESSLLIK